MKTILKSFLLFSLILSNISSLFAQENQTYWVHVDEVKPSKTKAYLEVAKQFIKVSKEVNLDYPAFTLAADNGRYLNVTEVPSLSAVDTMSLKSMRDHMGEDAMTAMFDKFSECYDNHYDYMISLRANLSYQPTGINVLPSEQNFRHLDYYFVSVSNISKLTDIAKRYKALNEELGSKLYYRAYFSGFGTTEKYLMIATAAKSAEEFDHLNVENNKLLGEKGESLYNELQTIISRFDHENGNVISELTYAPKN